jgi:hypothetical protein
LRLRQNKKVLIFVALVSAPQKRSSLSRPPLPLPSGVALAFPLHGLAEQAYRIASPVLPTSADANANLVDGVDSRTSAKAFTSSKG